MDKYSSVGECLAQPNPISREIALYLLDYSEEDDRLDYKETFNAEDQKCWLEITKDLTAFANTYGGYLVFGVRDEDKEVIGLSRSVADSLKDANNIHLKINRYLEPELTTIRAKEFRLSNKIIVILCVPQSANISHFISKDGDFMYPSGAKKTLLRKGTFYVRRSASNHLADSRDLDSLIDRRIDKFRDSLLEKVETIISAPMDSEIIVAKSDPASPDTTKIIYSDDPEALPIKGVSFSVSPNSLEEEIAAWKALYGSESGSLPEAILVWKWYANRKKLSIDDDVRLYLFRISLLLGAPPYYWVSGLKSAVIRDVLLDTIRHRKTNTNVSLMLEVAAFLGKGTYRAALLALGSYKDKIASTLRAYPHSGPRCMQTLPQRPKGISLARFRRELEHELVALLEDAVAPHKKLALQKQWQVKRLDNFLYARDDKYR